MTKTETEDMAGRMLGSAYTVPLLAEMEKSKKKASENRQSRKKMASDKIILRQSEDVRICLGCQMARCVGERECYLEQKRWIEESAEGVKE